MKIPIKKIIVLLLAVMFLIFAAHVLIVYLTYFQQIEFHPKISERFDINSEGNIPTWFSSFLLLFVGFSALTISFLTKYLDVLSSKSSVFWAMISAVYIFISFDEVAQIHELFDRVVGIKWVKVYAPFAFIFLIFCRYYLVVKKVEKTKIKNFILAGLVVHISGALIAEYISYIFDLRLRYQHLEFLIEESFEMFGTILVLVGALTKLNNILAAWNKKATIQ